jgi:hypothetical protein
LALKRFTPVDAIQLLNHQNPANIDDDTIILVIIIQNRVHHVILVCCNKLNKSTSNRPFYSKVSALKSSDYGNASPIFHNPNPGDIG